MARRGTPFAGVLYVGLALTARGPRVIEFNVRFGDPETQVVLDRLRTPLGRVLLAAATGALAEPEPLRWAPEHAVTVVVAAHGYPATPRTGDPVTGVEDVPGAPDAYVLHAGTARDADGLLVSSGGRVLSVVGRGRVPRRGPRPGLRGRRRRRPPRLAPPPRHRRAGRARRGHRLPSEPGQPDRAAWASAR